MHSHTILKYSLLVFVVGSDEYRWKCGLCWGSLSIHWMVDERIWGSDRMINDGGKKKSSEKKRMLLYKSVHVDMPRFGSGKV